MKVMSFSGSITVFGKECAVSYDGGRVSIGGLSFAAAVTLLEAVERVDARMEEMLPPELRGANGGERHPETGIPLPDGAAPRAEGRADPVASAPESEVRSAVAEPPAEPPKRSRSRKPTEPKAEVPPPEPPKPVEPAEEPVVRRGIAPSTNALDDLLGGPKEDPNLLRGDGEGSDEVDEEGDEEEASDDAGGEGGFRRPDEIPNGIVQSKKLREIVTFVYRNGAKTKAQIVKAIQDLRTHLSTTIPEDERKKLVLFVATNLEERVETLLENGLD